LEEPTHPLARAAARRAGRQLHANPQLEKPPPPLRARYRVAGAAFGNGGTTEQSRTAARPVASQQAE
jgi:hypothetical protein